MKPYLKLIALILASSLILNLQGLSLQAVILAGLILFLGRKSWERLRFLFWPLVLIIIFQLWSKLPLSSGLRIANLSLVVLIYTTVTSTREISLPWAFLGKTGQLLITLTFNLIPVILKEAKDIALIQSSRGKRLTTPLSIIVPLLHRTLQRSQQLAIVLEVGKRGVEPPRA